MTFMDPDFIEYSLKKPLEEVTQAEIKVENNPLQDDDAVVKEEITQTFIIKEEPSDEINIKLEPEANKWFCSGQYSNNIKTYPKSNASISDLESPVSSPYVSSDLDNETSELTTPIQLQPIHKKRKDNYRLILEVKKRPVLWNTDHNLHRNRVAMNHNWELIGAILGQSSKLFIFFLNEKLILFFLFLQRKKHGSNGTT